jgi:hypothetical protein
MARPGRELTLAEAALLPIEKEHVDAEAAPRTPSDDTCRELGEASGHEHTAAESALDVGGELLGGDARPCGGVTAVVEVDARGRGRRVWGWRLCGGDGHAQGSAQKACNDGGRAAHGSGSGGRWGSCAHFMRGAGCNSR